MTFGETFCLPSEGLVIIDEYIFNVHNLIEYVLDEIEYTIDLLFSSGNQIIVSFGSLIQAQVACEIIETALLQTDAYNECPTETNSRGLA